jgi:hypothetical protein
MAMFDRRKLFSMIFHITTIMLVLEILGVGRLIHHPVVMAAVMLSYYDLWIK